MIMKSLSFNTTHTHTAMGVYDIDIMITMKYAHYILAFPTLRGASITGYKLLFKMRNMKLSLKGIGHERQIHL